MENILRVVSKMKKQMREMQFNLNYIKRCIEEKMSLKMGLGLEVGLSKGAGSSSLAAKQPSRLIFGAGDGPNKSSKGKEPILDSGTGPFKGGWLVTSKGPFLGSRPLGLGGAN